MSTGRTSDWLLTPGLCQRGQTVIFEITLHYGRLHCIARAGLCSLLSSPHLLALKHQTAMNPVDTDHWQPPPEQGSRCFLSRAPAENQPQSPSWRQLPESLSTQVNHAWTSDPRKLLDDLLLFSRSVMSDFLQPHGLQQARLPCPSPSPGVYSNSSPLMMAVMSSNHLILCCSLLLLLSIFPSIRIFSNESAGTSLLF